MSARDFDMSNDDKQFGLEDVVEEEHADADDDDLDNCDDMIEKVIGMCFALDQPFHEFAQFKIFEF